MKEVKICKLTKALLVILIVVLGLSMIYVYTEAPKHTVPSDSEEAARKFLGANGVEVAPGQFVSVYTHMSVYESDRPSISIAVANKTYARSVEPDNNNDATWYIIDPVSDIIRVSYLPGWGAWGVNGRLGVIDSEIPVKLGSLEILSAIKFSRLNNTTVAEWKEKNITNTTLTREKMRENLYKYSLYFPQW